MFKLVILATVVATIVQHGVRYWFFMDFHKSVPVYRHAPGPCIQVEGSGEGSEDLTVLPDGLVFISSGMYPSLQGRILLFDFNQPSQAIKELKILGPHWNQSDFNPHGLSAWMNKETKEVTLMVVNHPIKEDQVEVFRFQRESGTLLHVKSIRDSKFTRMNDLIMTSETTFFITKYYSFNVRAELEYILMRQYGEIFYYDGAVFKSVASGLHLPNGINLSPDKQYLYVAEFGRKQLKSYRIMANKDLEHKEDLFLDTNVDNIEVDHTTGDLWIGCHPILYLVKEHDETQGQTVIPSQILKVEVVAGQFKKATEVYFDPGTEMLGSSVASVYNGRMIGGTLSSQVILCDLQYVG